jgi:hypothetical protein
MICQGNTGKRPLDLKDGSVFGFKYLFGQVEGHPEGGIEGGHFGEGQGPDIIGQYRFGKAHQFIAMNAAVMFQPFIDPNGYLG